MRELATKIAARVPSDGVVINQIPLLFETKGANRFDFVITISANLEVRKARLAERGLKSYEIERRISAQATDEERESIANCVIRNEGSIDDLERAVQGVWEREILPRTRK